MGEWRMLDEWSKEWCDECGHRVGLGSRLSFEVDGRLLCESCYRKRTPHISRFDLSNVQKPSDGILYQYLNENQYFWFVCSDADMAQQEATGYPVGEIAELEKMGDWDEGERGELVAIYVGDDGGDDDGGSTPYWGCTIEGCDYEIEMFKSDSASEALEHLQNKHGAGEIKHRKG